MTDPHTPQTTAADPSPTTGLHHQGWWGEVARVLAPLAWVAFGGPQAHLALLHDHIVEKRRWVDSKAFTELFAVCSMLPGPSSTQTVIGLGIIRAGLAGGIAALLVWIAPAISIMIALALSTRMFNADQLDAYLVGVRPAVVGVVAVAGWKIGRRVVTDPFTFAAMVFGAAVTIWKPAPYTFPAVLLAAGLAALAIPRKPGTRPADAEPMTDDSSTHPDSERVITVSISRTTGIAALTLFAVLLVSLITAAAVVNEQAADRTRLAEPVRVSECFYRNSSFIFGGGQVLLPLLQTDCVVRNQWVTPEQFGNGLGVMQASPGPLFSFSGYIGAMIPRTQRSVDEPPPSPLTQIAYGLLASGSIFLPALLLLIGIMPFWSTLRRYRSVKQALTGVNASAVGLVVAAVWLLGRDYLHSAMDAGLAVMVCLALGLTARLPVPAVMVAAGVVGYGIRAAGLSA
ncbi:MAG: chromate efflux transporter [Planctomycetes bacterium]|nr:chromate efflux transporter [Planctomycetota bacterium]NOG55249.1 chromate efflux transporter [Planctomycetota bacterium]